MASEPLPRDGITLGFSPCPNDTFIFHALVTRMVPSPCPVRERLEDVETLNRLVLAGSLDVSKISYHLLGHVRDRYALLRAGGALGRGCGPLVVAREPLDPARLHTLSIALPGEYTTASLLLRLFEPRCTRTACMPFHEIMKRVAAGDVDAGVVIHESRFTLHEHSLVKVLDLGQWWEETTGHPIPLGGIVARRELGDLIPKIDRAITASVDAARANPGASTAYVRSHSQEMSGDVCAAHIALYVNEFSRDLGKSGARAVECLMKRAEKAGIIPRSAAGLFY